MAGGRHHPRRIPCRILVSTEMDGLAMNPILEGVIAVAAIWVLMGVYDWRNARRVWKYEADRAARLAELHDFAAWQQELEEADQ
jgi:hypothetical protein